MGAKRWKRTKYAEIWQFLDPEKDCHGLPITYFTGSKCYALEIEPPSGGGWPEINIGDWIIKHPATALRAVRYEVITNAEFEAQGWFRFKDKDASYSCSHDEMHEGNPCKHCGVEREDVPAGECRPRVLRAKLKAHDKLYAEMAELLEEYSSYLNGPRSRAKALLAKIEAAEKGSDS